MKKVNLLSLLCLIAIVGGFFVTHEKTAIPEPASQLASPAAIELPGVVRVPIFIYHIIRPASALDTPEIRRYNVAPEILDAQFRYLQDHGYHTISPDDLVNHLIKGTPLPKKPVILTFDDGWKMQYTYAFPLLQKYHFTAVFYIFTSAIDHPHYLSWDEIKTLDQAGMIIGGHTLDHPYLFQITDDQKLRHEIIDSKKILEAGLGHPITAFAAPFGHYNDQIITIVKEAGFTSLRTTYKGADHSQADLFHLNAILTSNNLEDFVSWLR
jgi:peptidoglycan/xylan/chitin deacetylase (PgdA/CDA1 family)